jgi:hypothetical protein
MDGPSLQHLSANPEKVLRNFLDADGRIERMPAKASKRLVLLDHVAQAFDVGHRYPESEVNQILVGFYDDYASLRRYLVDAELLEREDGVYWRSGGTVDI